MLFCAGWTFPRLSLHGGGASWAEPREERLFLSFILSACPTCLQEAQLPKPARICTRLPAGLWSGHRLAAPSHKSSRTFTETLLPIYLLMTPSKPESQAQCCLAGKKVATVPGSQAFQAGNLEGRVLFQTSQPRLPP